MNKDRRKQIEEIKEKIASLQDRAGEIMAEIESVRDDEQNYFDEMPEAFSGGEKGEAAQAAIDAMDEVINDLQSFTENDFLEPLDRAAE